MVLLYRASGKDWVSLGNSGFQIGVDGDNRGVIIINHSMPGQYVLAEKDPAINDSLLLVSNKNREEELLVYPNPAGDEIFFKSNNEWKGGEYNLLNLNGSVVKNGTIPNMGKEFKVDISKLPEGVYFYLIHSTQGDYHGRIIKGEYSK